MNMGSLGSSVELGSRMRSHFTSQPMRTAGERVPHQYSRWLILAESIA